MSNQAQAQSLLQTQTMLAALPFASQAAISDLQEAGSNFDKVLEANSVNIEEVIADFQAARKDKGE